MKLTDPIRSLTGVGPKREAAFAACGVRNLEDLLWMLPKRYADRNCRGTLADVSETRVTIQAIAVKKGTVKRIRRNLSLFVLPIEEVTEDGLIVRGEAVWFNRPWLDKAFIPDQTYYFYGIIRSKGTRHQIFNPQFVLKEEAQDFFALIPEYPAHEGIPPESLKKMIGLVLDADPEIPDKMPLSCRKHYDLADMKSVFEWLHRPASADDVARAQYRLKFEEALRINLGIINNRSDQFSSKIHLHNYSQLKRFEAGLPFALTTGQIKVLSDIIADLKTDRVMNRLVLGDVGSGKTIIAIACAYLFALGGYQVAYMAPTEILAEQHAVTFENYLSRYGITTGLLTGSMKARESASVKSAIKNGELQVIIGTHALIQDSVDFYRLGLVVTDEQHRFGVRQRGRLGLKGSRPHTLVMSATPIPRTLSLVFYGDLDVSVVDVMPKGRKKIKTYFYGEKALPKIYDFTEKEMEKGYQALVVCPFIAASEEMPEVRDITQVFAEVAARFKDHYVVGCLHGKMSEEEKQKIIGAFHRKEINLLVATSIIEVGIDVPDISVMTIMSADRFGLSQLHQLRGRAGRGRQQAYCFLVSNARNEKTIERMKVIVEHQNGQEIAEEDYRLRGPGDYFGSRQHGFPAFKALDPYTDMALIEETRELAQNLLTSPKAEDMVYRSEILTSFYDSTDIIMN